MIIKDETLTFQMILESFFDDFLLNYDRLNLIIESTLKNLNFIAKCK